MTTALATNGPAAMLPEAVERVLIGGDLSKLSPQERLAYYKSRCEAAGLDPRTQPFQYIVLSQKLTLYATKACTDQLIASRNLTVSILSREYDDALGCYVVQCRVAFPDGRTVEDVGVLPLTASRGTEAMANAVMKCITKAKRRTVLSACGLGMLDETEVETIPDARREPVQAPPPPRPQPRTLPAPAQNYSEPIPAQGWRAWVQDEIDKINQELAFACVDARVEQATLIKDGKAINVFRTANHLITKSLEAKSLDPNDVNTGGHRDRAKAGAFLDAYWDQRRTHFEREVMLYLLPARDAIAKDLGLDLGGIEPMEATEPAAEPAGDVDTDMGGEMWVEDRV